MLDLTEEHNAPFCLFYGETNGGKTTSIIRTAPQPIYCISAEGDALKSVAVCRNLGETIDITAKMPESHEDVMDTLNRMLLKIRQCRADGDAFKFRTLLFDSGTYWMNCKLAIRVEDDRNEDRKGTDEGKLSAMTKTDWTEVNTINSQMARLTDLLKAIANEGVMVIMTAQMQFDPKWNNELEAAPCFNYKDYNKALKGYFDYIGYVMPNLTEEGKVQYPPKLSFSGSQGYLVKWRGVQPKYLITSFRLDKIFKWFAEKGREEVSKAPDAEPEEVAKEVITIDDKVVTDDPEDY
ncbi:MAG: hypothetical protein V3U75_06440 [Methylococcaceae bacterium]